MTEMLLILLAVMTLFLLSAGAVRLAVWIGDKVENYRHPEHWNKQGPQW